MEVEREKGGGTRNRTEKQARKLRKMHENRKRIGLRWE